MTKPPRPTSHLFDEQAHALLWHLARETQRSQSAALRMLLKETATVQGWDVSAIVAAYRAYKATKPGQ